MPAERSQGFRVAHLALIAALALTAPSTGSAADAGSSPEAGDAPLRIVITAHREAQSLDRIATTVQVIEEEDIRQSPAPSLTDLLAEKGVGTFSQWTPAQTSVGIRGARSDGQGRDFLGQVLVLVNGRRAGTANLSKLSLDHVHGIEIVRGPSSVAYGSQAMGGVINVITKTGRNTAGGLAKAEAGSWGYGKGVIDYAGDFDKSLSGHVGLSGAIRDDYEAGEGGDTQVNTAYHRYGAIASLSFDPSNQHRFDLLLRSDGVYGAGFRGSSWDYDNVEDRFNQSFDLIYDATSILSGVDLNAHLYGFRDVDDFRWGSEAAGIDLDRNRRELRALGFRLSPRIDITDTTRVILGLDLEQSELRSSRQRIRSDGAPIAQVAPFDINEDNELVATYAELSQDLFDEWVTLRGGARFTKNWVGLRPTPNTNLLSDDTVEFEQTTYSLGISVRPTSALSFRGGYATGFRAPTGTELAGEFSPVLTPLAITRGNPNLRAETSRQFEIGGALSLPNLYWDVAAFDTIIRDRIASVVIDNRGTGATNDDISQRQNAVGQARIQGIESQVTLDASDLIGLRSDKVRLEANGLYNFTMKADGIERRAFGEDADKLQRMNRYIVSLGATYSQPRNWSLGLTATRHGPLYYDTEENLIAGAEPAANFVHEKDGYWIFNLKASAYLTDTAEIYGGINNLLNNNYHPLFIALDEQPFISRATASNGGRGNSAPGRFFYVGLRTTF